ncbi:MAG: hypothetical protein M4D80_03420 [Myxococcota bacterium]|nr:hypothetical protein [Deltaproteobacteria bacterium]MDQ3334185.1 hypothetical protein [Myxococcota bacterium]
MVEPQPPDDPEERASDLHRHVSVAKVFTLDPSGPNPYFFAKHLVKYAWSWMTRRDDGVCVSIDTRRLEPGAYTVWFRVFDDPSSCNNPDPAGARCSRLDIPACRAAGTCSVLWVTGALVGVDGKSHVSACLAEGGKPGFVFFGNGLADARAAEIHAVLKHHGEAAFSATDPATQARLGRQLSTPGGNCEGMPGDTLTECPDLQVTYHRAPGVH